MKPKSSGLAPDVFIKQIENGTIPTVVCIVGEEPRTLLDAIFTDTPPDSRDITVFEEKTDMKKLDTLINTYPFFSGRTVIFITDKELLNPKAEAEGKKPKTGGKGKAKEKAKETSLSKQEQFQNLLGDVPDFCTVILQAEKMDGRQKFTKFLQKETPCRLPVSAGLAGPAGGTAGRASGPGRSTAYPGIPGDRGQSAFAAAGCGSGKDCRVCRRPEELDRGGCGYAVFRIAGKRRVCPE